MRRENSDIKSALTGLGIPEHLCSVKVRPSEVNCDVAFGGHRLAFSVRSGTTEAELRASLARVEQAWSDHVGLPHQVDLEELLASAPAGQAAP